MEIDHNRDHRERIAKLTIENMVKGQRFFFNEVITEKLVDEFARLSGDYSNLHMINRFARERGYKGRVVHGALLISLLSRLVGMHFPGQNAVLLSMNTQFTSPAYIGDNINISAEVDHVSLPTKTIVLKVIIVNTITKKVITRSKILIGFTNS